MTPRHLILAGAITLALAACGGSPAPNSPATAAPATDAAQPAPAPVDATPIPDADAEAPSQTAPADTPAAAAGSKPALVADCATTIESNDAMQYSADSISVPASCSSFTIHLKHVGKMPVAAMGHNVVIATEADMRGIVSDGISVSPDHVKAGDSRVIAHSAMIGGGGSTSVSFDVAKISDGGPYRFFCSFPGHLALMQGSLQVQ